MADVFTRGKRSEVMAAIRSKGNRDTEICLASVLRKAGIKGWRRHMPLAGKPDFVFREQRVAVFVDGCFWHGCPKHGRKPQSNRKYWNQKLARNKARDRAVTRALKRDGWVVLRIWEHELKAGAKVADRIAKRLGKNLEARREML
jgi:DNA mismatch endonuclease (patch repair protein)